MLSDLERDRLIARRDQTPRERASNDMRVRKKLTAWLKDIPDVLLALDKLPEDQTNIILSNDNIFDLYKLIDASMHILKFSPIDGRIWDKKWFSTQPSGATDLDIWRSWHTYRHIIKMYDHLGNRNPIMDFANLDPLDRDPEFHDRVTDDERKGLERIRRAIANKSRESRKGPIAPDMPREVVLQEIDPETQEKYLRASQAQEEPK